jgi:hypothetical protein
MRRILPLFLVLGIFLSPGKSFANTIQIEPAYIDVSLKQGEAEKTFELFVANKSDSNLSLDLSSIDFRQTDPYGAVSFLGKEINDYSYALSSFLSFESNNIELGPKERRRILVTVRNRQDLSPGGHYAAVILRQRSIATDDKTVVSPALSSLVYLVKEGGERYNLSFKAVDFPRIPVVFSHPSTYTILLQNDGNVHLTPYGRSDVKDIFGRVIYKGVINENSIRVFPQSRRYVPVYAKKVAFALPISINKIEINGRDSLDKTKFSYEDYFLYVNPVFLGFLASLLSGLVFVKMKRKGRNKK